MVALGGNGAGLFPDLGDGLGTVILMLDSVLISIFRTGGGVGGIGGSIGRGGKVGNTKSSTEDSSHPLLLLLPLLLLSPLGPKACFTLIKASSTEARARPTDSTEPLRGAFIGRETTSSSRGGVVVADPLVVGFKLSRFSEADF